MVLTKEQIQKFPKAVEALKNYRDILTRRSNIGSNFELATEEYERLEALDLLLPILEKQLPHIKELDY